jgi:hypothetical protein
MRKDLVSDFIKVINPYYQPDTFEPYLSVILTLMTVTILLYSVQASATNIYAYASKPSSFKNKLIKVSLCTGFVGTSLQHICQGIQNNSGINYNSNELLSSQQDLHSLIN